jgi:hypothetical protein
MLYPPGNVKTLQHHSFMKNKTLLLTFLSLSALAVGCDKEQSTSRQIDKLHAETKQAAQEMTDYSFAQKTQFTEKMQGQLAEINQELDQLSAKVEKSSEAVKAEAKPRLQALRDQAAHLSKQLEEGRSATESTWNDVKAGTRKTYDVLKDSFQQSRQWVSEKIAP